MRVDLPDKYKNLVEAEKAGIRIPPTLFLDQDVLARGRYDSLVSDFVSGFAEGRQGKFIVRSAVSEEDSALDSLAGHFRSVGNVGKENLFKKIREVFNANLEIAKRLDGNFRINLMIQPYIEAAWAGVAFYPWKYFGNHFLINYSSSGAESAVEGRKISQALVSIDDNFESLIEADSWTALERKSLSENVKKLSAAFDFNFDAEWLIDEIGNFVLLQIRPITASPLAIKQSEELENLKPELIGEIRAKTSQGYVRDDLSESLGVLCPFSFSVFQKLFTSITPKMREFGFSAKDCDFLYRLPDGNVLVNNERKAAFFRFGNFLGGLNLGMKNNKYFSLLAIEVNRLAQKIEEEFSFDKLSDIFFYWHVAGTYVMFGGKEGLDNSVFYPNEYDLILGRNFHRQLGTGRKNWGELRSRFKELFSIELDKLRDEYSGNPVAAFSELQGKTLDYGRKDLKYRYDQELFISQYNYLAFVENQTGSKAHSVGGSGKVEAEIFAIKDPALFSDALPKGKILVAPYFRNDWILDLHGLAGVILEQGGTLSHSAIVARERGIPYFINYSSATTEFDNGCKLILDGSVGSITKK